MLLKLQSYFFKGYRNHFSLLEPDPGGKHFQKKKKNARRLVVIASLFKFFKVNFHKPRPFLLLSNMKFFN